MRRLGLVLVLIVAGLCLAAGPALGRRVRDQARPRDRAQRAHPPGLRADGGAREGAHQGSGGDPGLPELPARLEQGHLRAGADGRPGHGAHRSRATPPSSATPTSPSSGGRSSTTAGTRPRRSSPRPSSRRSTTTSGPAGASASCPGGTTSAPATSSATRGIRARPRSRAGRSGCRRTRCGWRPSSRWGRSRPRSSGRRSTRASPRASWTPPRRRCRRSTARSSSR